MAPPVTVQAPAACGVQPLKFVPLNMETRFGSPYGLPPPPFSVCTVSGGLAAEMLPAASRALTVVTWSAAALGAVHPHVRAGTGEPGAVLDAALAGGGGEDGGPRGVVGRGLQLVSGRTRLVPLQASPVHLCRRAQVDVDPARVLARRTGP